MKNKKNENKTIFTFNSLEETPNLLKDFVPKYKRWLLVTSPCFRKNKTCEYLTELHKNHNTEIIVIDDIKPNPNIKQLNNKISQFSEYKFDGILALGGGSVIDTGKVLSLTLSNVYTESFEEVLKSKLFLDWQKKLPIIAIPTTAGTGAEITPFATIWDEFAGKKFSLSGELVRPDTSVLDPTLTLSLPYKTTFYSGLDAISHACESLWNKNKTPITERFSTKSLELANKYFEQSLLQPDNLQARSKMLIASNLAGIAISYTKTALAHSISYPLTLKYGLPHGIACSFTLPTLIDEYLKYSENRLERSLLIDTRSMLKRLNLLETVKEYTKLSDITRLTSEMENPERAGNINFHPGSIESIIIKTTSKK